MRVIQWRRRREEEEATPLEFYACPKADSSTASSALQPELRHTLRQRFNTQSLLAPLKTPSLGSSRSEVPQARDRCDIRRASVIVQGCSPFNSPRPHGGFGGSRQPAQAQQQRKAGVTGRGCCGQSTCSSSNLMRNQRAHCIIVVLPRPPLCQ